MNKIFIIGIGYKPLDRTSIDIIHGASVILASNRLFEVFKQYEEFEAVKDKVVVINNVDETINYIRTEVRCHGDSPDSTTSRCSVRKSGTVPSIILLASGDPMFFGIGRRAVKEFGKDRVEIIPDLSSIQLAFAKIKEPWDDAFLMSLHGGPDPEKRRRLPYELSDIPSLIGRHKKLAVLTDKENNPAVIATVLVDTSALPGFRASELTMFVCERLGYPDEKIIAGTAEEIAGMSFSGPNVVIIMNGKEARKHGSSEVKMEGTVPNLRTEQSEVVELGLSPWDTEVKLGLTEDEIVHSRGLITKDEVRAVTIHKLKLPQKGVFWDIGAGSGSVSIEAARVCPGLKVFAVEKVPDQLQNIRANKGLFNVPNVEVISGSAPDALAGLPVPDRVFIGGSGGNIERIINFIAAMPTGIIVVNATTIETLNRAVDCLKKAGFNADISQVSVSRTKSIGESNYLSALNPVFVIKGTRESA